MDELTNGMVDKPVFTGIKSMIASGTDNAVQSFVFDATMLIRVSISWVYTHKQSMNLFGE